VVVNDSEQNARDFIHEFKLTFPNGMDRDGSIAESFWVTGIPATFFVTRDGKIFWSFVGAITDKQLSANIEELLK